MKPKSLSFGLIGLFRIIAIILPVCTARHHTHGHRRNDQGRFRAHFSLASAGSSIPTEIQGSAVDEKYPTANGFFVEGGLYVAEEDDHLIPTYAKDTPQGDSIHSSLDSQNLPTVTVTVSVALIRDVPITRGIPMDKSFQTSFTSPTARLIAQTRDVSVISSISKDNDILPKPSSHALHTVELPRAQIRDLIAVQQSVPLVLPDHFRHETTLQTLDQGSLLSTETSTPTSTSSSTSRVIASFTQVASSTLNTPKQSLVNSETISSQSIGATSLAELGEGAIIPLLNPIPIVRRANHRGRFDNRHWAYQPAQLTPSSPPSSATSDPECPSKNGTIFQSNGGRTYQILCDIDFLNNDYPFKLVDSFEDCIAACEVLNSTPETTKCVAALFVPSRKSGKDDCYLKSAASNPITANFAIEGALLLQASQTSLRSLGTNPTTLTEPSSANSSSIISSSRTASLTAQPLLGVSSTPRSASSTPSLGLSLASLKSSSYSSPDHPSSSGLVSSLGLQKTSLGSSNSQTTSTMTIASYESFNISSNLPTGSGQRINFAPGNSVIIPKVAATNLHGPTQNVPSKQYLDVKSAKDTTLNNSLLTIGANGDLTTSFGLAPDTGVLEVNKSTQPSLAPLKNTPHISRDGGRGGFLNGQHLFVFCDTGSYTAATEDTNGDFLGFVSSSVATDIGMNGLDGNPIDLEDGIGQWSDDVGRMRGFSPLTEGEQSYNVAMQGHGQRYAVWPESSIIPLDAETALIYAPIVYDNVNRDTKATVFTYTGTTLLSVTAGGKGGPMASRRVDKIFTQNELEWGCAGGIRSWGPSGIGGTDGKVYIFGNIQNGILLSRSLPENVADRDAASLLDYEYWNGTGWTPEILDASSTAFFITGSPFMDIDIFYSPRHLTFIAVYLTAYVDNKFYYRYLKADTAILPPFAPRGDEAADYVENILKYEWSDEFLLYSAPPGLDGKYIYSGGVHQGYYGSDDITNGGSKMLLSWTAPTGLLPSTLTSEYQIITAEVYWT